MRPKTKYKTTYILAAIFALAMGILATIGFGTNLWAIPVFAFTSVLAIVIAALVIDVFDRIYTHFLKHSSYKCKEKVEKDNFQAILDTINKDLPHEVRYELARNTFMEEQQLDFIKSLLIKINFYDHELERYNGMKDVLVNVLKEKGIEDYEKAIKDILFKD